MEISEKTIKALFWIVNILDRHHIKYQITGGFAGKLYGSPRELNDIDIDIRENDFEKILPEVEKYVNYGPERYNDGKWDGEFITADYHGQQIDIGGIDSLKISNKNRTAWIPYSEKWFNTISLEVGGLTVQVLHPRELARYKKELDGDHQLLDVAAAESYAKSRSL